MRSTECFLLVVPPLHDSSLVVICSCSDTAILFVGCLLDFLSCFLFFLVDIENFDSFAFCSFFRDFVLDIVLLLHTVSLYS